MAGIPRRVWIDSDYDGGGWVLVASHPRDISLPSLTYAQAAQATSSFHSAPPSDDDDPKTYAYWMGLEAWTEITAENNAGNNVVSYVSSTQVALGATSDHTKRARWKWDGWNIGYSWNNPNSILLELGYANPGLYSYHAVGGYQFSTID